MNKLDKYIINKFFTTFLLAISLLLVVVIVFDFSEKIDDFISEQVPLKEIVFQYYFNFIPYFLNLFLYLFVFISVIFFTSKMAQNSEIIAILSSGISYNRFLLPYVVSSSVLLVLAMALSNFIIPETNVALTAFEKQYIHTSAKWTFGRDIHVQIGPSTYAYVKTFDAKTNQGSDFTLENIDLQNGMTYKLYAKNIYYDTGVWILENYFERKVLEDKEIISEGAQMDTVLNLLPKDFVFVVFDMKTMNYFELKKFISEERTKGVRNITDFEVEQHSRIANSFATIILTLLGVGLSSTRKRSGMGINLGIGISLTFVYILLMQITKVFATNSSLPSWIAAWLPNILYAFITLYVIRKAAE